MSRHKPQPKITPERKADDSFDSYGLTMKEAARIAEPLAMLLGGEMDDGRIILNLLVLLKSFTYTRDHSQREYMLTAVEKEFSPYIGAVWRARRTATAKVYSELVEEGGKR
ncbi:MAG: hypothetical protein H0X14_00105 [Acidobacteria bacterium]|nr:hypothetical protein [Acidobacteriota bacterium]